MVVEASWMGTSLEGVALGMAHTTAMGVEEWMWGWRVWRVAQRGEPCPSVFEYEMDMATGANRARLPANLRARLDAVQAAGKEVADEQPFAPFLPRPESPPAAAAMGSSEETGTWTSRNVEQETEHGPNDPTVALMHEDDTGPEIYVGMDTDPANAPLLPMPTAAPPPHQGSCERRRCRFNEAEGIREHRLSDRGKQAATSLAGAMSDSSSGRRVGSPGRSAWRMCPCLATRFALSIWGTQQSWTTVRGTYRGLSRRSASR